MLQRQMTSKMSELVRQAYAAGISVGASTSTPSDAPLIDAVQQLLAGAQPVFKCVGLTLDLCKSINFNYPFTYHQATTTWTMPTEDGTVFARGERRCMVVIDDMNVGTCGNWNCLALGNSELLKSLVARTRDEQLHREKINDRFLTSAQLSLRKELHSSRASLLRVVLSRMNNNIQKLRAVVVEHKQILTLLAQNDVPLVRLLLSRCASRGALARMILKKVSLAIDGRYRPRAVVDEYNLDKAELALILGGARLLWALERTDGYICKSAIFGWRERPRFITSWDDQVHEETVRARRARPRHKVTICC